MPPWDLSLWGSGVAISGRHLFIWAGQSSNAAAVDLPRHPACLREFVRLGCRHHTVRSITLASRRSITCDGLEDQVPPESSCILGARKGCQGFFPASGLAQGFPYKHFQQPTRG